MDMHQFTGIFCEIDDFCEELNQYMENKLLPSQTAKRGSACCLSDSEIMTIIIFFSIILSITIKFGIQGIDQYSML